MIKRFFLFAFFCCLFLPGLAVAEDKAEKPKSEKETIEALNKDVEEQMKKATEERQEAAEATFDKMTTLMQTLEEREQQHFFLAYTNYNMIETVRVVQRDVGNAIDKCGENNPDMKEALETRFKEWNDAVDPLIKEAGGNLDNMLLAQDYASKETLDEIFSSIDETREKTNSQIEKIPVTTPEACQYLLSKMDETQTSMLNVLRATLVTFPQVFQQINDGRGEDEAEPQSEEDSADEEDSSDKE